MDVARAERHGLGDDQVDQLHDRGVGCFFLRLVRRLLDRGFGEVDRRVGEFLQHRIGALAVARAVVAVDRLDDLLARGQGQLHLAVQDEAELFLRVDIRGIARGDTERRALLGERKDRVFTGHALRQQAHDGGVDLERGQIDELDAEGLGEGLHHLVARGIAEPHDLVVELLARRPRQLQRFGELLGADDALGDQDVGKRVGHGSRTGFSLSGMLTGFRPRYSRKVSVGS